jgi:hypothetical protein
MDPDQISLLHVPRNSSGKQSIDFLISIPCIFPECNFAGVVVDERPENTVCATTVSPRILPNVVQLTGKAVVVKVCMFILEEYWNCSIAFSQAI